MFIVQIYEFRRARALYFSFLFSFSEQHNILMIADVFEAYLYQFLRFFCIVSNG